MASKTPPPSAILPTTSSLPLLLLLLLLALAGAAATAGVAALPAAYAHQIDSVGEYRIQIGWMQEPAVSGEPNGVELYVSPLDPSADPEDQPFADGVPGLHRDLKIQLILAGESTTLPLRADHNTPGKYFALVEPSAPGFYQVNVLGSIGETVVSKSLHAPRVENKEYLRFPQPAGDPILVEHEDLKGEIARMKESIQTLESSQQTLVGYAGLGLAAAAIVLAVMGQRRRR